MKVSFYSLDTISFAVFLKLKADDLYQDTFLTALEKTDRISVSGNPGSYHKQIMKRLIKKHR